jgi:hypothetical protein
MKKEGVIVLIVVLVLGGLVSLTMQYETQDSEQGFLNSILDVFSFKWLTEGVFGNGELYGVCTEDLKIKGSEFCSWDDECGKVIYAKYKKCEGDYYGNEYSSAIAECSSNQLCSGGECVSIKDIKEDELLEKCDLKCKDDNGNEIIPGPCQRCDTVWNPPKIVEKKDGESCEIEGKILLGGFCSSGNCLEKTCENLEEKQGFSECGNTCCGAGETCWGYEQSMKLKNYLPEITTDYAINQICCDSEKEFPTSTIKISYLPEIKKKLEENGISIARAERLEEIRKKYHIEGIVDIFQNEEFLKEVKEEGLEDVAFKINQIKNEIASDPEAKDYSCQKVEASCRENEHLCAGSIVSNCCPNEGANSVCLTYTPSLLPIHETLLKISAAFDDDVEVVSPKVSIGLCGNPYSEDIEDKKVLEKEEIEKNSCPVGTTHCKIEELSELNGGVVCCEDNTETCVSENPYASPTATAASFYPPTCQPKSCEEGYSECTYNSEGAFSKLFDLDMGNVFRICCRDGVEMCVKNPLNYLRCVNIAKSVGNPSKTKSTSVYMIRGADDFELNGIGYVIEPSILFAKDVRIVFNQDILFGEDVHKYSDHQAILESCENVELKHTVKNIGIKGGEVNLNDEVVMTVPQGAINENIEFTITSYNLSECYKIGKKLDVNGIEIPRSFLEEENSNYLLVGVIVLVIILLGIVFRKKLFSFFRR